MQKILILFSVLALAVCAFIPVACVASRIEDPALFAPAQLAWPAVRSDYDRGVAAAADANDSVLLSSLKKNSDDMTAALDSSDVDALRLVPWSTMHPWCSTGIAAKLSDGEIGPGVADSLIEQLTNFTITITRLQE